MRLQSREKKIIKQAVNKVFGPDAVVYLFGSRTDDQKQGGDIDLYIETNQKEGVFQKKVQLLGILFQQMGEQKIDVIINNFKENLFIYQIARQEGKEL